MEKSLHLPHNLYLFFEVVECLLIQVLSVEPLYCHLDAATFAPIATNQTEILVLHKRCRPDINDCHLLVYFTKAATPNFLNVLDLMWLNFRGTSFCRTGRWINQWPIVVTQRKKRGRVITLLNAGGAWDFGGWGGLRLHGRGRRLIIVFGQPSIAYLGICCSLAVHDERDEDLVVVWQSLIVFKYKK